MLLSSRSHSRLDNMHNLAFFQEFCHQAFGDTAMDLARGKITIDQAIDEMEGLGTDLMIRSKKK